MSNQNKENVFNSPADHVWLNGNIYTVDNQFSRVQALAYNQGFIVCAGSNEDVRQYIGSKTQVEDLGGKTVLPGFIDSHLHLMEYGQSLLLLKIRDLSKQEILDQVKEAAKTTPPDKWIVGGIGWNNEVWDDPSYPTMQELDAAAPNHPALLPRMDGHMIWVNSRAFKAAGITDSSSNPPQGEFLRASDGRLQGCASNAANQLIRSFIPVPAKDERRRAFLAAQEKLLAYGVTGVQDANTTIEMVQDIKELLVQGEYKLRFAGALSNALKPDTPQAMKDYLKQCPEIGLFDGRYTLRSVKFLADGSVGAQSAALLEDYLDRPGHRGMLMFKDEEFYAMVKTAAGKKMQAITHAIGDAAIDQTISVYGRVLSEIPLRDHRFRIEHFQTVTGNSRERAKVLGILASMQPTHAPNSASMALRRLGQERARGAYAAGLVLSALGQVAAGSDAPVAPPDPIDGIHSAVTRTNNRLEPKGGFFPENALTREQAVRAYTIWAAYALFVENERGSIERGKRADFVILDKDIMNSGADEILKIKVLRTVIGGEDVYRA
jgi:predicted amidohydrolase YtcJ